MAAAGEGASETVRTSVARWRVGREWGMRD
jgi:hypothetical protein